MGKQAFTGRGRAKPSGGKACVVVKCLRVKGIGRFPVDGWQVAGERAAEASFGIGESIATEFGWGHRQ